MPLRPLDWSTVAAGGNGGGALLHPPLPGPAAPCGCAEPVASSPALAARFVSPLTHLQLQQQAAMNLRPAPGAVRVPGDEPGELNPLFGGPGVDWRGCFPKLASLVPIPGADYEFDAVRAEWPEPHAFTPEPSSTACGPPVSADGPVFRRLMLAVSPDGVTWTKTGEVIANHADVPALAVEGGVLYLYFIVTRADMAYLDPGDVLAPPGQPAFPQTPMAMARTTDLVNWTYRLIGDHQRGMTYFDDGSGVIGAVPLSALQAMDPSVVAMQQIDPQFPNDRWFLHFTLLASGARGHDAATFIAGAPTLEGPWVQRNGGVQVFPAGGVSGEAADPSVLWVGSPFGGGYYQYFSGALGLPPGNDGKSWSATVAADGVTVLGTAALVAPMCDGHHAMPSNGLTSPGLWGATHTWFSFVSDPGQDRAAVDPSYIIASTLSNHTGAFVSGMDGTPTPCSPLLVADKNYEYHEVRDPAVVKFGDCYVMVYVTEIPHTPPNQRRAPGFGLPPGQRVVAGPTPPPTFVMAPPFVPRRWLHEQPPHFEPVELVRPVQPRWPRR